MTDWTLERYAYTPKGTFGVLTIPGVGEFQTIEQDWENNKPYHSCIPCGDYELSIYRSPTRGNKEVILLDNPSLLATGEANGKPRTYIEIHPGNWMKNVKGCIAPGEALGDSWNVTSSSASMEIILTVLGAHEETFLRVKNRDNSHYGYST